MKLIKRMLCLLLCAVMLVTYVPSSVFAAEEEYVLCDGEKADTAVVSELDAAALSVDETAESYRWEIYVPSAGIWAALLGGTGTSMTVTNAMVKNVLDGSGCAKIRCAYTQDGEELYTRVVSVSVDHSANAAMGAVVDAPVMMKASRPATVSDAEGEDVQESEEEGVQYTITVRYLYEDGSVAYNPYTATVPAGTDFSYTVETPVIPGFTAYEGESVSTAVVINVTAIAADVPYTVVYKASDTTYTVKHCYQNVAGTDYPDVERETYTAKTGSTVPADLAKEKAGFYPLPYARSRVEADGSTEIEILYNRQYYLLNYVLGEGGYGTESVYAPYGAAIPNPDDPTREGYAFNGWDSSVPTTMPVGGKTLTAKWLVADTSYTIVYWHENADDEGYSQYATKTVRAKSGTVVSGKNGDSFTGSTSTEHKTYFTYERADQNVLVKGDGSTVVNVYYSRNEYTVYFYLSHYNEIKSGWNYYDSSYDGKDIEMTIVVDGVRRTFKESNDDVYSFTAKYDSNISDKWPTADNFDSKYYFRRWQYSSGNCWLSPQSKMISTFCVSGGYYCYADCGKVDSTMIAYYMIESFDQTSPAGGSYATKDRRVLYKNVYYDMSVEDSRLVASTAGSWDTQKEIAGTSKVAMEKDASKDPDEVYMYYKRLRNTLKLYTGKSQVLASISNVMYGMPMHLISQVESYVSGTIPVAPGDLEKGAYEFAGWYTTAEFRDGTQVNLASFTMPNSPANLYAKWVPVTRTINTYLTKEAMDSGAAALGTYTATHGTKVETTIADPTNGNDFFVGWFYMDGNTEKAFDFGSMSVNQNMNVYAKWSANPIKTYIVHYQLADGTPVADDTVGEDLVDTEHTFHAKGGDELYVAFRENYYPDKVSAELVISGDAAENVITFVYTRAEEEAVPYTVRYLEEGTLKMLRPDKVVSDNTNAVVTEQFEPVSGYIPDAYRKEFVIRPSEENVLTFWYTKDLVNIRYRISHYIQDLEGDGYNKEYAYTEAAAVIGTEITATPLNIDGFTYNPDAADTLLQDQVGESGAHLKLYYTRNEYPFEVRYLEQGTDKELKPAETGMARYALRREISAAEIPGYGVAGSASQTLSVAIETGDEAVNNVITFYYTENTVDIHYAVIGPEGCGSVEPAQEQVYTVTGTPQGGTATAAKTFRFVGWYLDAECTVEAPAVQVAGQKFTPAPNADTGRYEAATYYAKFEYDIADLTIRKTGVSEADAGAPSVFRISGNGVDLNVVVYGNGSATVKDLVSGTYTVTEVAGYWRYGAPEAQEVTMYGQPMSMTFSVARQNHQWLDDFAH